MSVKSIQQVSISLTSATSNTATITSVDTANAIIIYTGTVFAASQSDGAHTATRVALTNATTVTATINTSPGAITANVTATIIEFNAGSINSIQAGTIAVTATSGVATNTATITSVNTAKSFVIWLGATTTQGTSTFVSPWTDVVLTNATTVTASSSADGSLGTVTVGYMVVEFK